jgi:site-specific recombinase XerD
MTAPSTAPTFASLLQDFFCQRLTAQRNASPRTIASYRDTFRLLLRYLQDRGPGSLTTLTLADLDAPVVLGFLDHLERDRHNSVRSRNARLAALRSFYHYVASRDPAQLPVVQRVLAIPRKRHDRPVLGFLQPKEMQAVQEATDRSTWSGRRDHVLLATLYNTGARVSEVVSLRASDFVPGPTATVHLRGKGRKERRVPLWKSTARLLSRWITDNPGPPDRPLFPNRAGQPLTRSGVAFRLRLAAQQAADACPSLRKRKISPHTVRHTTAMHLLQSGVDITVIALWLGHANPTTTHGYVEADLAMKKRALDKLLEPSQRKVRFTPSDRLLAFLDRL